MDFIEKYVYEVVKHLPESTRNDVEKELRSNILDMLPDEYTEEDVKKVLTELGDPSKLSKEYKGTKRYLIGPEFYDTYLLVLKIVAIVIACVMPFAALITAFEKVETIVLPDVVIEAFVQLFAITIQAAFQAFAWVTVIFAILERTGVSAKDLPVTTKVWTVEALKDVNADNRKKINISDPIASIIFSIVFLAVMRYSDVLLGWYNFSDNTSGSKFSVMPLFNSDTLNTYFPLIVALTGILIFISVLKLVYRRWNYRIAAINLGYNLLGTVFAFLFLTNNNLINQGFINLLSTKIDFTVGQITTFIQQNGLVTAIIVTIAIAWDTVEGFLNARRSR